MWTMPQVMEVGELIAKVPELDRVADIVPVPFRAIPSTAIGPAVWPELLAIVHETAARPEIDGIAITHGTATLEETAYFLNLTVETEKTVVLVGAQRPASGLSTDAFLNLLNAVRVAGAPEARGMGVLTVLNDEIHAAREVTKTHSARAQTFKAPDFGVLGHADEDRIAIYRRPVRVHAPAAARELGLPERFPRVEIAYSYGGSDGAVLRAMADLGAEGIVMAALAPGNPTPEEHEVMEEVMARGVVFVMGTRAGRRAPGTAGAPPAEGHGARRQPHRPEGPHPPHARPRPHEGPRRAAGPLLPLLTAGPHQPGMPSAPTASTSAPARTSATAASISGAM